MSAAPRASLLILGSAAFIVSADARVIDPLLSMIATEFHVRLDQASIVSSAYTFPYGLFQLFYGPLGDRIGKLRVMAVALSLFAFGTAGCALVPNLPLFALLRFLTGVVAAAIIPLSLAYVGDKFPYEERQAALTRFMSALMLGLIMGESVGGVFGKHIGWRGVFILFGVVALAFAFGLWRESNRFPEEKKPGRGFGLAMLAPYGELMRRPASRLVVVAVALEGFFFFGGFLFLAASMEKRFHLPTDGIGAMMALYGVGGLIYSATVKRLVKRLGELGIMLMGAVFLCTAYLVIARLPFWQLFIPCIILLGMGFYSMHSTLQTKATEMAPGARGTAVSLFAFGLFLGQATGVWLLGKVAIQYGFATAFTVCGISLLVLALVLRALFPRLHAPAPKP